MLNYTFAPEILAFSAGRDEQLPVPVLQAHQTHTDRVAVINSESITREDLYGIDALITAIPDLAIGVRTADCIPILLYDPKSRAIAAIHSGWRGTILKISQKTIAAMSESYGTSAVNLHSVIGPGIGPDNFQVGEEVVSEFRNAGFPMERILSHRGDRIPKTMKGGFHIDLWEANRFLLEQAGVTSNNINLSGICTYASPEWYSARREGPICGRNINAIMIASVTK